MHNTTEIEKSLEDYPLIPMNDIEEEARLLAVRWVENYGTMGFDIQNKHRLASDIMNYAIRHHEKQSSFEAFAIESIKVNERIHQQIGEVGKLRWVKLSEMKPETNGRYYCRDSEKPDTGKVVVDFTDGKFRYLSEKDLLRLEWLDESATDKHEELQEEVERLRAAIRKISTMQLNSAAEAEGRFYDCIDIAEEALNRK